MDGTRILVIGTEGSIGVMSALRVVCQALANEEFNFAEAILRGDGTGLRADLSSSVARHKPGLLLLCVPGDLPALTGPLLEEI